MSLPPRRANFVVDNRPLAPSIRALATKILAGEIPRAQLEDIKRLFAYRIDMPDVRWNDETKQATDEFVAACEQAYGEVPESVMRRLRKGTVQGGDLIDLFALEL